MWPRPSHSPSLSLDQSPTHSNAYLTFSGKYHGSFNKHFPRLTVCQALCYCWGFRNGETWACPGCCAWRRSRQEADDGFIDCHRCQDQRGRASLLTGGVRLPGEGSLSWPHMPSFKAVQGRGRSRQRTAGSRSGGGRQEPGLQEGWGRW